MRGNSSFILPLLMIEQPLRVFAVNEDVMRDTARLGAGPGAMFDAQRNDLLPTGWRDREGSRNDDHNFSVARVVLFDMK